MAADNHYSIFLQYDKDGYWIATHPELPGCKADGTTPDKAVASLEISRKLWLESSRACNLKVSGPNLYGTRAVTESLACQRVKYTLLGCTLSLEEASDLMEIIHQCRRPHAVEEEERKGKVKLL